LDETKHQSTEDIAQEMAQRRTDSEVVSALDELHPTDVADVLEELDIDVRKRVFQLLDNEVAIRVLDELDDDAKQELVGELERRKLQTLVADMPTDEAADMLALLPPGRTEEVLDAVEADHALDLRELVEYPPESAGGIMTKDYLAVTAQQTAQDAVDAIRNTPNAEVINYIYVIDAGERLVGVLSLRDILLAKPGSRLETIAKTDVVSVETGTDQEEVARVLDKYDYAALPVVDGNGILRGVVTYDDAIDVMEAEASEDIYLLAGTAAQRPTREPAPKRVILRLPWLLITLVGGIISSRIMLSFGQALEAVVSITFFVPVINGMGGNVGLQSSTVVVRGLATGEVHMSRVASVLLKEIVVGAMIGLICGSAVGIFALFTLTKPELGLAVAIAMFCGITVSALTGTAIPLVCEKLGIDPALAAGPFITTLNDITCLTIYLATAIMLVTGW
jgi:magnesium transporter